jgi:hypothetical protein
MQLHNVEIKSFAPVIKAVPMQLALHLSETGEQVPARLA